MYTFLMYMYMYVHVHSMVASEYCNMYMYVPVYAY